MATLFYICDTAMHKQVLLDFTHSIILDNTIALHEVLDHVLKIVLKLFSFRVVYEILFLFDKNCYLQAAMTKRVLQGNFIAQYKSRYSKLIVKEKFTNIFGQLKNHTLLDFLIEKCSETQPEFG